MNAVRARGRAEYSADMAYLVLKGNAANAISLSASRSEFPKIREYIDNLLNTVKNCELETRNEIQIAVEEVFINIANYAYHGKNGKLIVSYAMQNDDTVFITFADQGTPFNPLALPNPDTNVPLEDREEGGFGVYLVRRVMDAVAYVREDGWNRLTIGKRMKTGRGK